MKPIAIFYHGLFYHGPPFTLRMGAVDIVREQMSQLADSGLADAAAEIVVGLNGPVEETREMANLLIPSKAKLIFHGPESFAENLTLVELQKWVPAHINYYVLYCHAKSSTHDPASSYGQFSTAWRRAMMKYCVSNWRTCVADLDSGYESVGCHYMRGMADGSQNYWGGNIWWCKASFLLTIPSIFTRERIKMSGIAAAESRYEAEVLIGNGPRLPSVKEYLPNGGEGCI